MLQETYYLFSIIIAILSFILAVGGVIFAYIQIKNQLDIAQKEREKSRKHKAVEMVIHFSRNISIETKFAERIVKGLTLEQCRNLYNFEEFDVEKNTIELVCAICYQKISCKEECKEACYTEKSKKYKISGDILYSLRKHVISYLNNLESVLLAWYLGIVDREIIEDQFKFLNRSRTNDRTLKDFRGIAGNGDSYPAIEAFYKYLDEKADNPPKAVV